MLKYLGKRLVTTLTIKYMMSETMDNRDWNGNIIKITGRKIIKHRVIDPDETERALESGERAFLNRAGE